jgi:glucosamine--fructose-6-phosphate aminotransferase (isomerizing)
MCTLLVNAGPEISVASTKAYTSQMLCITMIALLLGQQRTANAERCREIIAALGRVPSLIRDALKLNDRIHDIALQLVNAQSLLLIGRGYQFATCLEAALVRAHTHAHTRTRLLVRSQ